MIADRIDTGGGASATPVRVRRDDIQGLRAIGALLVAVYHIWVGRVSGGVDIFFVVSGYLLIGSMARAVIAGEAPGWFAFTVTLARRLLPASYFVIAAVLVSSPLWLPKMRWALTIEQVAASTLYVENWYLGLSAVDYLKRDEIGSPLQHYWAMSAQVQALLICAATLAIFGRIRRAPRRGEVMALLGLLFLGSLGYSVVATAHNQAFAYYDTFARIWEFALGGLTALLMPLIRLGDVQRRIGGWLALAAILSCGVLLNVSTVFPGYAALWPTLAGAAILICGQGAPLRGSASALLAWRPFVWLGNISYGLYLWHWPLLVAYLTLFYRTKADALGGMAVLGLSILLAWATTRWIEGPVIRTRAQARPIRTVAAVVVAVGLLGAGAVAWKLQLDRLRRAEKARVVTAVDYPGARIRTAGHPSAPARPVHPGPITARSDRAAVYADGCHQSLADDELLSCSYGRAAAPHVIALVGGSHSAHWLPALQEIVARDPRWRIVTYTKSSCLMAAHHASEDPAYAESCRRWNERLTRRLLETRPDIVFTTATRAIDGFERVPLGFHDQWRRLTSAGLSVAAVRDNPWFGFNVPECVEVNGPEARVCAKPRSVLSAVNPATQLPSLPGLRLIDLTPMFCTAQLCLPVIGNVQVISDKHHVTTAYMRSLSDELRRQMQPLLDRGV